ncbi:MAG: acyl carrier protein [Bacilli bacterium]|jgi:acyl carrier protein
MDATMQKIKELFAQKLGVKEVDSAKTLKDLGLDSLDVVELLLDLEDEFGIQFDTQEMSSYKTVQDLYNAIEAKLTKV